MQTFLPYPNFKMSAQALDRDRLGKQRGECIQILNVLTGKSSGWFYHPAVEMWRGYEDALRRYTDVIVDQWVLYGYNNNIPQQLPRKSLLNYEYPWWLGWDAFHNSHRANLVRKDPSFYNPKFKGTYLSSEQPYIWPCGKYSARAYKVGKDGDWIIIE